MDTEHKCPICKKIVEDFAIAHTSVAFQCHDVMEGLAAWSGYAVPRTIICQNEIFVHFSFDLDGHERLVKMVGFDLEGIAAAKQEHANHPELCWTEGCKEEGIPCYFMHFDEEVAGYYCWDHAQEEGFCPSCGMFSAGFESFDFSQNGLCAGCNEAIQDEMDDSDDSDDDLWEYPEWEDIIEGEQGGQYIGPGSDSRD